MNRPVRRSPPVISLIFASSHCRPCCVSCAVTSRAPLSFAMSVGCRSLLLASPHVGDGHVVGEYPCNRVEHRSLAIAATTMTEHEGVLEHTSSQAVAERALNKLLEFNVAVEIRSRNADHSGCSAPPGAISHAARFVMRLLGLCLSSSPVVRSIVPFTALKIMCLRYKPTARLPAAGQPAPSARPRRSHSLS